MVIEGWDILSLCFYVWIAGIHAEYMHNHTCNAPLSVLMSLVWPILLLVNTKAETEIPKYYRDKHNKGQ